jgi:hypothetical protein
MNLKEERTVKDVLVTDKLLLAGIAKPTFCIFAGCK